MLVRRTVSVQKIGRNEPCPCGSGKKYKKCCLAKEQENSIRQRDESTVAKSALEWLSATFPDGIRTAVQTNLFSGLKKAEKLALDELAPGKSELLTINIGEWLLTEAKIPVQDDVQPVRELLLAPEGPGFSDVGRRWLSSLGERPLSLYEVQQLNPGEGVLVKDLLLGDAPEVWVSEKKLSQSLVQWDIFGARLVLHDDQYRLSGAVYPFQRETATSCKAKILRKAKGIEPGSEAAREIYCSLITTEWFRSLVASPTADSVQDTVVDLSSDTVEKWVEEPQASLGDRSPRNALRTAAGRKAVVELLKTYENQNAHHVKIFGGEPFVFEPLWDTLGLQRSGE
ncbi:MAG: hypothetical protein EG828_03440 [Deltaproteobacteria bacterium]|nr:hypothetical protein [Deltaproteobacteria bacterium]